MSENTNTTVGNTIGIVLKEMPVGTVLTKMDRGAAVTGYWTGMFGYSGSTDFALIWNTSSETVNWVNANTEMLVLPFAEDVNYTSWAVERSEDATTVDIPATVGSDIVPFLKNVAALSISKRRLNDEITKQSADHSAKLDGISSAIRDWAESNLDEGGEAWQELSQLLTDAGLEGFVQTYKVSVSVTYTFDVEVDATSAEKAREEVEENLGDYASDHIDLDYVDSYDVDYVELA